jgi:hypothetical protein
VTPNGTRCSPAALAGLRGAYGIALCAAPGPLMGLLGGPPPGRRARAVARMLGARHLAQASLLGMGGPAVASLGAEVDLLHAASMFGLALVVPRRWRAGLADGLIATAFAAASISWASRTGRGGRRR